MLDNKLSPDKDVEKIRKMCEKVAWAQTENPL